MEIEGKTDVPRRAAPMRRGGRIEGQLEMNFRGSE